jgi:hydrogenase nickel incorporation protein HypA/HybF
MHPGESGELGTRQKNRISMHELSVVMSIVETAAEQVRENNARSVERIDLVIGALAGIDPHALDFAWDVAVRNTVLDNAERNIISVAGRAKCVSCNLEFEMKEIFDPCPVCGDHLNQILQGKELLIKSMVLN